MSIAEIAKRAGVSKGLIYNYYRSKDALRRSGEALAPEFTRIMGQFIALFAESDSEAPRMDALVLQSALGLLVKAHDEPFPSEAIKKRAPFTGTLRLRGDAKRAHTRGRRRQLAPALRGNAPGAKRAVGNWRYAAAS
ncbi:MULTISPECIES: TetR/AcrR family transcriptional regulator [unclassified Myxococcus]|uniref:TetR/AcrR family transcriptional regulator n=1 Tax=Myxococcus TaxID=32 RepID=UPI00193C5EEC|nr:MULTISPECIES: TetR/AcrR family transcriptional regulator [unclassified Myxococcus]